MARTRLVIDADLVEQDLLDDPIEVEIPGLGVSTFPGVMPANAVMRVYRWQDQGLKDLTPQQGLTLLGDLVPSDVLEDWSSKGFDVFAERNLPTIEKVIHALLDEYTRRSGVIADAGPAPKPQVAATPPPYSGIGVSSSPTSGAPTASPCPVT